MTAEVLVKEARHYWFVDFAAISQHARGNVRQVAPPDGGVHLMSAGETLQSSGSQPMMYRMTAPWLLWAEPLGLKQC